MTKQEKALFKKIASEIEEEYQMGGLTGSLYEDFAFDVLQRFIKENHPAE